MSVLRIHHLAKGSRANGPGVRTVVWTQGCSIRCPGCHNPGTWDPAGGREVPVAELLEGVGLRLTLSGGEPFEQAAACAALAEGVRARGGDVVVFTGRTLESLTSPSERRLLAATDLLIDGPWEMERSLRTSPLRASANQRLHFFSPRIRPEDLREVPAAEWLGGESGAVITGVDMLRLARLVANASRMSR